MFRSIAGKFTTTGTQWEMQRKAYVTGGEPMNAEFERFRKVGRVTPTRGSSECFTLPGRSSVLNSSDAIRLPAGYQRLRVTSGSAWITFAGLDYILSCGQEMTFDRNSSDAVVSSVAQETLNFEITC